MSMVRVRASRPRMVVAALAAAAASGLVGCDQVSDETKAVGAAAVCSQIEVEPAEIENNPETARLVALLVRDLAPDENIRAIAAQVAQDPNLLDPRAKLADWVDKTCRR